jgi:hypothetical protein
MLGTVEEKRHLLFNPFGTGVLYLIQINQQTDAIVFQFIILKFI